MEEAMKSHIMVNHVTHFLEKAFMIVGSCRRPCIPYRRCLFGRRSLTNDQSVVETCRFQEILKKENGRLCTLFIYKLNVSKNITSIVYVNYVM